MAATTDQLIDAISSKDVASISDNKRFNELLKGTQVQTPNESTVNNSDSNTDNINNPKGSISDGNKQADTIPTDSTSDTTGNNTTDNAIDARGIIELGDIILSRICVIGLTFADVEANISDFKLTADEKKKIEPVAGRLLHKYGASLPDEYLLALLLVAVYGGKIAGAYVDAPKKAVKKAAPKKTQQHDNGFEGAMREATAGAGVKTSTNPKGAGRPPKH